MNPPKAQSQEIARKWRTASECVVGDRMHIVPPAARQMWTGGGNSAGVVEEMWAEVFGYLMAGLQKRARTAAAAVDAAVEAKVLLVAEVAKLLRTIAGLDPGSEACPLVARKSWVQWHG